MATTTQKPPLKTYLGSSMAEALAKVKQDLGPEAVILHTRTFRDGGVLGLGARELIEITASTDSAVVRPRRIRTRADLSPTPTPPAAAPEPDEPFIPTPPWFSRIQSPDSPSPVIGRPARQPAPPSPEGPHPAHAPAVSADPALVEPKPVQAPPRPQRLPATRVEPAPTTPEARDALQQELAAIRKLVGQVLQSSRRAEARAGAPAAAPVAGPLADLALRLLDTQVAPDLADEITSAVRDDLSPDRLIDEAGVRQAILRHVARRIPVVGEDAPPARAPGARPRLIALIGPTGVGKTTTVAKLAATCKLRYGRRVGLVTADTYRIAAVEQLRTYADIVGMPLKVVLAPSDLPDALESLADCDAVFLDTAGRSQRDHARLDELAELLDTARPDETHLVLSLASAESVIAAAVERYGRLKPDRIALTKLDEAVDFGVILNTARRAALPVSFVTTGQEVPDHIETASADRLARLVLDGAEAPHAQAGAP